MIPLEDAQHAIAACLAPLDAVEVPTQDAVGLALAADVVAPESVPPFANTAVDGFAVRAIDTTDAPVVLRVVGELPAGKEPTVAVGRGEAIRIMTGAPLPGGADAVIMVEHTEVADEGATVRIGRVARVGDHVRDAGGDLATGEMAFPAGTVVGPAHLGVLAGLGIERVVATRRARVGVCSTGDELVEAGPLEPGRIRDANRPMLMALVALTGANAVDLGIVGDDADAVADRLSEACATCDLVLTSGGVSVGDYDHVRSVLEALATGPSHWWQVAIKPAKPLSFAMVGDTPVFGLPGNPVSSLVSFELFARPSILGRMGHRLRSRPVVSAVAAEDLRRAPDGKLHLDRVTLRPDGHQLVAKPVRSQASNVLSASASANGLALLPDGDGVASGDAIRVMRLDAAPDH